MKLNFKEKKQQNKGITLIALIITIIVLLILAVVAIREVQGDGIISKAKKAKEDYEKAQSEEQSTLDEYLSKIESNVPGGEVQGPWKQEGDTITNPETKQTLKIGDYVAYNEAGFGDYTAETSKGAGRSATKNSTTGKYDLTAGDAYKTNDDDLNWRVLGVNAKGELELISDNPTTNSLFLANEEGYLNAGTVGDKKGTLDTFCNTLYGNGKGSTGKVVATGARSLNVDDIDKLAGITTEEQKKKIDSNYGVEWQYRYPTRDEAMKTDENVSPKGKDDTLYMQYKKATDAKWTDITGDRYQTFRLPGESETIGKISATEIKEESRNVKYTYYNYTISNYVKQTTSDGKSMADIITKGTGTSNISQWLASPDVTCGIYYAGANFGVRGVYGGAVGDSNLFYSIGGTNNGNGRVRPVVSLKSDIQIDTNAKDGKTPSTAYEIK